ncbi:hypothetical protein F5144DRAFT_85374 [Chaetomium tenue]|uniref:Uncharacterized protein n=1 Tax=Chaetomium tenue TaxID=1854479 RepID=A0ACB7PR59_9PEZI|nr:hypothetical protein F5144DRAFT_85374 [Chaetomium globosum]
MLPQRLPAQDLPAPETVKLTTLLLQSQPIPDLVQKYIKYAHDFPTYEEQARGTVQVWGRGETGPSHSPTLSDSGDISLDPDADFSEAAVQKYIKSYVENIQNMYPLLTPSELRAMPSPKGESIESALTLLVLALGKICLHPRIPDVMPLEKGSLQGGSARRNMDVIPGLDYFACASRILGGQLAADSLTHIQVDLLAGLYYGQLVRPIESYAFVRRASHKLQQVMRRWAHERTGSNEHAGGHEHTGRSTTKNAILFAFGTCLDLESDLVAELRLPPSGLSAYQSPACFPDIALAEQQGFDKRVLESFCAHWCLREAVAQICSSIYTSQGLAPYIHVPDANAVQYAQTALGNCNIPSECSPVEAARLRDRYWGGQAMIYRPFINLILKHDHNLAISPQVIQYAGQGVQALVESTRAFHNLGKRFIISSIFRTAHTQWCNLVTLSAVIRNTTLRPFVDDDLLRKLFSWTIDFFKIIALPTSALFIDLRILESLQHNLWGNSGREKETPDA